MTESVERGIGEVLRALQRVEVAARMPVDSFSNEDAQHEADGLFSRIRPHLSSEQARSVAAFLEQPPPTTRTTAIPQHNDLGAEHILVDDRGGLTGIIDWTDAARADPARDLGSIYRDLGPASALRVSESLGRPITDDEVTRMRFVAGCRWIEDMAYAVHDPATRGAYLANAQRTFAHTFGSAG